MSLADVTGDGLADLITPNPDRVAVLVAGEDGGFRSRADLAAPFGPLSVVAADMNECGRSSGCGGRVRMAGQAGPHPLDELFAGTAFEQCVGHPVDVISAG